MRVGIVGSGYVGTTVAACFADAGHRVTAIDIDESVVSAINAGDAPIHEPGLEPVVERHGGDRLRATDDLDAVRETDLTMLALPTPSRADGGIDLSTLTSTARSIGTALREAEGRHLLVVKSTVIPGSTDGPIADALLEGLGSTSMPARIGLAVNPEFLREGSAIDDFRNPDKVVIGTRSRDGWARSLLDGLYEPVHASSDPPIVHTGMREAEMIKYANNAFLASKISLINDLGNICKAHGIDTYEVANALGLDHRIEGRFLRSGIGWGGSCFGKDLAALIAASGDAGYRPPMLEAAIAVNDEQPRRMLDLLDRHVDPTGRRIAVLGLAFKPGTDDIRDSRSIPLIEGLLDRGAAVVAYDPVAMGRMRDRFPEIEYADAAAAALRDAHGALVATDWDEFGALNEEFSSMARPIVIDGRRIVNPPEGVIYEGLTW